LSTTDTQSPITNPGNLTELYDAIITAEDKNRATNQEIIKRYYSFGEELEKIFDEFKSSYRGRKAQRMLVKEVTAHRIPLADHLVIYRKINLCILFHSIYHLLFYDFLLQKSLYSWNSPRTIEELAGISCDTNL
jgi:hypothetical protein